MPAASRAVLSVILPVYNAERSVLRAVHSVLASDFSSFELIIVDDGSADDTPGVVATIDDPRIKLMVGPHRGVAAATNTAVSHAQAPLIARMDADDVATADRLGKQFRYLQETAVDAVAGRVRVVDDSGRPVQSWQRYQEWVNEHLEPEHISAFRFVECPVANPTVMARREVFELGFREGPWPEDYDFWLRVIAQGFKVAKLADYVLDWTDRPNRLTRTDPRYSPDAFDRCRRQHLLSGPLHGIRDLDLWGAGQTGKPWMRWLIEQGFNVHRVIDVAPGKIGQRIHSVPVIPPERLRRVDARPILIAVGAAGARPLILEDLLQKGFIPGQDAWFVA